MNGAVIIGAGLAGSTCARRLQAAGVDWVVLEVSDAEGGCERILWTDSGWIAAFKCC